MAEVGFPVSDYYKNNIIDAETISRSGTWWTAVLLINDPQTKKPMVILYQWQKVGDVWKARKRFAFKNKQMLEDILKVVQKFGEKLA
jgi:hypothetical protein